MEKIPATVFSTLYYLEILATEHLRLCWCKWTKENQMGAKNNQNQRQNNYQVNLNKETFDELQDVRSALTKELGFEPTNGQVIRHLIYLYYNKSE